MNQQLTAFGVELGGAEPYRQACLRIYWAMRLRLAY